MRNIINVSLLVLSSFGSNVSFGQNERQTLTEQPAANATAFILNGEVYTFEYLMQFATLLIGDTSSIDLVEAYPILTSVVAEQELAAEAAIASGLDQSPELIEALELLRKSILADAFIGQEIGSRLDEARLQLAYSDYVEGFIPAPVATASHILVETELEAVSIIEQLESGASFEMLAREFSVGPSGPSGGKLGTFGLGQMVPSFEEAAFSLNPGSFSNEPVQTQFGYHVIYLEDLSGTEPENYESVLPALSEAVQQQIQMEIRDELRTGADLLVTPLEMLTAE